MITLEDFDSLTFQSFQSHTEEIIIQAHQTVELLPRSLKKIISIAKSQILWPFLLPLFVVTLTVMPTRTCNML